MNALAAQPEILKMVDAFLARHGHRCIREVSCNINVKR